MRAANDGPKDWLVWILVEDGKVEWLADGPKGPNEHTTSESVDEAHVFRVMEAVMLVQASLPRHLVGMIALREIRKLQGQGVKA